MILNRPNLYIAAPLFSSIERQANSLLRDRLSSICDVYLPQEDGALLTDLVADGMPIPTAKTMIFERDINAINRCNILLIVMDGRVIDEGASFELGYAFSMGKICVGLKNDIRSLLPIGDNPMIECALRGIFSEVDRLITWISREEWKPI